MSASLIAKYGNPMTNRLVFEKKWMVLVDMEKYDRVITALPSRVYMNKNLEHPLKSVLDRLITSGLYKEIRTWDGCYNVRFQRGSNTKMSKHCWGLAIDLNAAWNPLVKTTSHDWYEQRKRNVKWTEKFLQIWRDEGFNCGADWKGRLDGMHFELDT